MKFSLFVFFPVDNSSLIISTYASALTTSSSTYCREGFCSESLYYYQALLINVSISGYYSVLSGSDIIAYGYLYNDTFDPWVPSDNIILENYNGPALGEFGLRYFLQRSETYIVVVTTLYAYSTGYFWLFGYGPAAINYNQLNLTGKYFIYTTLILIAKCKMIQGENVRDYVHV